MSVKLASAPVRNAARSAQTRRALLDAGRELFTEHGFAAAATEQVVKRAGVTRGALYYHYKDKQALFRAVFEDLCQEVWASGRELSYRRAGAAGPRSVERVGATVELALDLFLDPGLRQVLVVEGPSVLGWDEWRRLIEQHFLTPIRAALGGLVDAGRVRGDLPERLTDLLFGAVLEAGLLIAHAPDEAAMRGEVGAALLWLVERLRPNAATPG